jgi:uncharacterized membrane protein YoaK (UPF0700 family)
MYRLERQEFVQPQFVSLFSLLSFQAGFLNAFGFVACGRYVSHVTGFGTQIGTAIANNYLTVALELVGFPLSYILGSFVSGFITIAKIEKKMKPRFNVVVGIFPVLILTLACLGMADFFGPFGQDYLNFRDFLLLYSLTFACGMQNGCFATLTKGQIRTTHLTGIVTDIGTDLSRLCFGRLSEQERELTKKTNFSRIMTFFSFTIGSIVSVTVAPLWGFWSLGVPMFTSFVVFVSVLVVSKMLDKRFEHETVVIRKEKLQVI